MSARSWGILLVVVLLVSIVGYFAWPLLQPAELPEGIAASNGRIEAVEIDVATKTFGRLTEVLVDEGDFVTAGQVLARMDADVLEAQLHEAEATLRRAESAVVAAGYQVKQRESEKDAAKAVVLQRQAELTLAKKSFERAEPLAGTSAITKQELDSLRADVYRAEAAVSAAEASVAGGDAAIATAQAQVIDAEAAVDAAKAMIERLRVDIEETVLKAPRDGRVQFLISRPGEVLSAGGKVLNMIDLVDVYMTFFLPTQEAGRIRMGDETRIILDAAPQYVVPARISYVADVAQFTPKTVETAEERQKLMFRIKARIDPDLLKKHVRSVKTGLPGMAYVRIDPDVEWPDKLRTELPK